MTEKEKIREVITELIFDNMRLKTELQNKAAANQLTDDETSELLDLIAKNRKIIEMLEKELK